MTTMVSSISTIMVEDIVVCEVNVMVLPTIVAEGCIGVGEGSVCVRWMMLAAMGQTSGCR